MGMTNFLPYAHQAIDASDIEAVTGSLSHDLITRGPCVQAFEAAICQRVGAAHAVAFSSGSSALCAAFQAARVGPLDQIVTTPNTFIATVAEGVRAGAHVQLVDIDTYGNIDIDRCSDVVNPPRTRGRAIIVPVHFAGVAVDMEHLDSLVTRPDTVVIEDAAHALGSLYPDGSPVGNCRYSDMTIFSFHPAKNITCGEGGMVTTNDETLFNRLRLLRNSGIERAALCHRSSPEPWYYEVTDLSCNFHMTECQAALGTSQLLRLELFAQNKQALTAWYRSKLASVPGVTLPPEEADCRTHRHLFVVRMEFEALGLTRTRVMDELRSMEIGTQYHYVPLYCHPALGSALSQAPGDFPAMEEYARTALSIPFFSSMTEADVDRVVAAVRKVIFST
jgi:dTDP-4-amino-4,6-dideoxygalactose transaminase